MSLTWTCYHQVRKSPKADAYFELQRARALADDPNAQNFFPMMVRIGQALQKKAKIIPPPSKTIHLKALDICMAPGGYSATVLKFNSYSQVCGVTLPEDLGGHRVHLPDWQKNSRVKIQFLDITMLAAEMGFPDLVSQNQPGVVEFSNDRPFQGQQFDVVFCDGKVLDTHTRTLEAINEPVRLTAAQLTLAFHRIKYSGTLIMLLHQSYGPHNVRLLEAFNQFSQIEVIKHQVSHVKRSSFYLVAKNVDPQHPRARRLIDEMRWAWRKLTAINFNVNFPDSDAGKEPEKEDMKDIMDSFGEKLLELAEPGWKLQTQAMVEAFLSDSS